MILCLMCVFNLVVLFCIVGSANGSKNGHLRRNRRNLIKELNLSICIKGVFDSLKRGKIRVLITLHIHAMIILAK